MRIGVKAGVKAGVKTGRLKTMDQKDKKGMINLMVLIEVIAVLSISYLAIEKARSLSDSVEVLKETVAEDVRLMLDTLVGVPGDALVEYPLNISSFNLILKTNVIYVFEPGEPQPLWTAREFYLPQGYIAEGVLEGEEKLCLEKEGRKLLLRKCP